MGEGMKECTEREGRKMRRMRGTYRMREERGAAGVHNEWWWGEGGEMTFHPWNPQPKSLIIIS
jgi:hypothetical protein